MKTTSKFKWVMAMMLVALLTSGLLAISLDVIVALAAVSWN